MSRLEDLKKAMSGARPSMPTTENYLVREHPAVALGEALERQAKKFGPPDEYLHRKLDPNESHNVRNPHTGNMLAVPYADMSLRPPTVEQIFRGIAPEPVRLDTSRSTALVSPEKSDSVEPKEDIQFYLAPGTQTPVAVLLGPGGTGKTYKIREYEERHPTLDVLMTATTGVAAINIGPGCVTINSAFKFFNEASLVEALKTRKQSIWREVQSNDLIVVDEVSMLSSGILDLVYNFVEEINRFKMSIDSRKRVKLLLSGDFCQLPPIAERSEQEGRRSAATPFAFRAKCWDQIFEPAITKLTKNYRQAADPLFQQALHMARIGNAGACVDALTRAGVEYSNSIDYGFPGLTLYPINKDVAAHNAKKLAEINLPTIEDRPWTWGEQHRDWKEIPSIFVTKVGAQVRTTANRTPSFEYVNGDIAKLHHLEPNHYATVELLRDGSTHNITPVFRYNMKRLAEGEQPPKNNHGWDIPLFEEDEYGRRNYEEYRLKYEAYKQAMDANMKPYYDPKTNKHVIGMIAYIPLTLGYASTFHRAQGLTQDHLQIDIQSKFSDNPQMMYVALSRCRQASNIRITRGGLSAQGKLASRIRAHPDVLRYV